MIVVDASVAVKWLLPERGAAAAQELLQGGEILAAPSLIRIEVAAAIARKARLKEMAARDAEQALELWLRSLDDGVLTLIPEEDEVPHAYRLSLKLNHPLQDCIYLATAQRYRAQLITADEKFAVHAQATYSAIRILGQL